MPHPLKHEQVGPGQLGDPLAPRQRDAAVLVPVDSEHRAANVTQRSVRYPPGPIRRRRVCPGRLVSALVSMAQPTASSRCLVECGSQNHSPKKNSLNPRQSRSK